MKLLLTSILTGIGMTACGQQFPQAPATDVAAAADTAATESPYETDTFTTRSGKTITFHALMHASIRMQYEGKEYLIDPVRQLGDRRIDYTSMPQAGVILVTHEHGDHFDQEAIKTLTKDGTRFITNRRCAEMAGYGEPMANGDTLRLAADILIEAVPAYNITEGHLQFHPRGRDNGYVLTIDGTRIYIAGDTEDIPDMERLHDIDIAFLPCNQPYTMTPTQLIHAARMVKPRVLFPYHYGQTDVSHLPEALKAEGIDVRIRHYEQPIHNPIMTKNDMSELRTSGAMKNESLEIANKLHNSFGLDFKII